MAWNEDRGFAIDAAVDARMGFVRKTYAHLLAELVAVAAVVAIGIRVPAMQQLGVALLGNPIIYIAVFFGVALLTRKMLEGDRSIGVQYAAAGIWVLFFGLLLTPLSILAAHLTGSYMVLAEAGILTGCAFTGLTAYVFYTKKDFSFLGGALSMVSWLLIGFVVLSFLFGRGFGLNGSMIYSGICVLLMSGWVLYDTSKILHHRHVNQAVAASVELLIDFVYMFIHILMLLLNRER
jgi:FtsH-binding integral membrane protein